MDELKNVIENQSSSIKICTFNSRSLSNKITETSYFIKKNGMRIHIMAITETWLHKHISDALINITGFQPIFRRDRPLSRQGGGVCFFVSNEQPAQRRNDLDHPELELLWLEIRPNPLRSCRNAKTAPSSGRLLSSSQLDQ